MSHKSLLRKFAYVLLLACASSAYAALPRFQGWAERGGARVVTAGALSSTRVQQSAPGAAYTVKLQGTATIATLYSDAAATTPKVCPCAADSVGAYAFYTASGQYDVYFSAPGVGSWVQTITVGGGSSASVGISILDRGAVCDNVTDDTVAIQATIDIVGPHRVLIPDAICKTTSTLTIAQDRVWIVGQGKQASKLHFTSAVSGAPALAFSKSTATLINQCGVSDLTIYTDSTPSVQKVGIRITDSSEFTITQVAMYPFTSNSNSIGIQYRGREFFYLDHVEISADQPISIEDNPNSASIDIDHAHFSDLYLLTQANLPAIKFANGVYVTNFISDGTNSCTGGSDCIYNVDTTTTSVGGNAIVSGWRWEQPASAGRFLTWSRNQRFFGLTVRNNLWGAGTTMSGILLRNADMPTISGNSYLGTLVFMDIDSTVRSLHMPGNFVQGTATNSLAGQLPVFKINKSSDSTTPDYVDTWYDSTNNTNITSFGKLVSIGGLNVYAASGVSVLAGAGNRVAIPIGAGGLAVGYIEVSCRGTTLTEGGTVAVSSLGASLIGGTTNFDSGNVAGKVTVFWENIAQITLMNQTAENMTCGYMHWWF